VTSPEKKKELVQVAAEKAKRVLVLGKKDGQRTEGDNTSLNTDMNRSMPPMHVENQDVLIGGNEHAVGKEEARKKGTSTQRARGNEGGDKQVKESRSKRSPLETCDDGEESGAKEQESGTRSNKRAKIAGLADQPCKPQ
jgi:hypothetical protein